MNKTENGNQQLNSIREEFNQRLDKKVMLGNTKRIFWNKFRRHWSI